jgi:hypothetical protein
MAELALIANSDGTLVRATAREECLQELIAEHKRRGLAPRP